ncbi:MAG: hypothetical protein ACTSSM_10330 [Promethearchaeota archaeon]
MANSQSYEELEFFFLSDYLAKRLSYMAKIFIIIFIVFFLYCKFYIKYGVIGKKNGSKNLKDSVNEIFSKPYPDQNIKEPGLEYVNTVDKKI